MGAAKPAPGQPARPAKKPSTGAQHSWDTATVDHELTPASRALLEHLRAYFAGRDVGILAPAAGPIHDLVPALHVLTVDPAQGRRLYTTAGVWDATQNDGHGLEFVLHAPRADDRHVETLTMAAYYHATGGDYTLGLGHTVPIGRPWIPGSMCDHLLVSLPYPWEPELETCIFPDGRIRVLWLLPITEQEKIFRHSHDLEALEQRLEAAAIIPTDPRRPSVV
jgi:hypothetical protein